MILSERVPKTVSRTGFLVVLLLGLLALPGWSQVAPQEEAASAPENAAQEGEEAVPDKQSGEALSDRPEEALAVPNQPARDNSEFGETEASGDSTLDESPPTTNSTSGSRNRSRPPRISVDVKIPVDDGLVDSEPVQPSANARDARLRQLERRMQALMQELRGLLPSRTPIYGAPVAGPAPGSIAPGGSLTPSRDTDAVGDPWLSPPPGTPLVKPKLTIGLLTGDSDCKRFTDDYGLNARVGLGDWLASRFSVVFKFRAAPKGQHHPTAPTFLIEGTGTKPQILGYKSAAALKQQLQAKLAPLGAFNLRTRKWMPGAVVTRRGGVSETAVSRAIEVGEPDVPTRQQPSHVVETKTITLSRTTYRLNRKKGEALAAFLMAQLDDVQVTLPAQHGGFDEAGGFGRFSRPNTKVDMNTITVVALPETQEAIGRIIAVMQKAKPRPTRPVYRDSPQDHKNGLQQSPATYPKANFEPEPTKPIPQPNRKDDSSANESQS